MTHGTDLRRSPHGSYCCDIHEFVEKYIVEKPILLKAIEEMQASQVFVTGEGTGEEETKRN